MTNYSELPNSSNDGRRSGVAGQQSPRHSRVGVALPFDSVERCCLDVIPLLVPSYLPGLAEQGIAGCEVRERREDRPIGDCLCAVYVTPGRGSEWGSRPVTSQLVQASAPSWRPWTRPGTQRPTGESGEPYQLPGPVGGSETWGTCCGPSVRN